MGCSLGMELEGTRIARGYRLPPFRVLRQPYTFGASQSPLLPPARSAMSFFQWRQACRLELHGGWFVSYISMAARAVEPSTLT